MTYLLDTNIVSYFLRGSPEPLIQRILNSRPADLAISVVSLGELHYGLGKLGPTRRAHAMLTQLESLLTAIPVAPLPREAASHYGLSRAHLEQKGTVIGNNDLWIAAHALAAGMTLVTNNVSEFKRVPHLKIENWLSA